ncbi:MAG: hypothetical protein WBV88_05000 [Candidatus Rickettsiella isopodorum]
MPNSLISTYSIQETYQILEKTFSINHSYSFYRSEFISPETTTDELLRHINTKLQQENTLVQQLTSEVIQGLINPNYQNKASELVTKINLESKSSLTPNQIKKQLSEFIDFSKLTYFIFIPKLSSWKLTLHTRILEKFTSITKLKFNIFLDNLGHFLESTLDENSDLVKITETLINNYFPNVANASYPFLANAFLKLNGTHCGELKKALLNNDIPMLQEKLNTYHKNMAKKRLIEINNRTVSDRDDYLSCEDDEEDKFFDAEEFINYPNSCHNDQSSTYENKDPVNENLSNNPIKKSLMEKIINWFRALIQHIRNTWFSNKLNNSVTETNHLTIPENTVSFLATTSKNNNPLRTKVSSSPYPLYQRTKKNREYHHLAQNKKYSLNH